jgi:hypothetical protein
MSSSGEAEGRAVHGVWVGVLDALDEHLRQCAVQHKLD